MAAMKLVEIIKNTSSNVNIYPQNVKKKLIFQFGELSIFQPPTVSVKSERGWAPRAWHEFGF